MKAKLYQFWRSSASWRVRWALALKGVAVEIVSVDLPGGEQRSDAYRAKNPMGRVPTLEIDGVTLSESVAIIEYLEERIPNPPLFPKEPLQRARVRQILETINSGIQPLQNSAVIHRHSTVEAEQQAWMREFNQRGLEAVERLLDEGPFAFGRTLGVADLFLVPQVAHAQRFGMDISHLPRVSRAYAAAMATEHAQRMLPKNQPDAPADA